MVAEAFCSWHAWNVGVRGGGWGRGRAWDGGMGHVSVRVGAEDAHCLGFRVYAVLGSGFLGVQALALEDADCLNIQAQVDSLARMFPYRKLQPSPRDPRQRLHASSTVDHAPPQPTSSPAASHAAVAPPAHAPKEEEKSPRWASTAPSGPSATSADAVATTHATPSSRNNTAGDGADAKREAGVTTHHAPAASACTGAGGGWVSEGIEEPSDTTAAASATSASVDTPSLPARAETSGSSTGSTKPSEVLALATAKEALVPKPLPAALTTKTPTAADTEHKAKASKSSSSSTASKPAQSQTTKAPQPSAGGRGKSAAAGGGEGGDGSAEKQFHVGDAVEAIRCSVARNAVAAGILRVWVCVGVYVCVLCVCVCVYIHKDKDKDKHKHKHRHKDTYAYLCTYTYTRRHGGGRRDASQLAHQRKPGTNSQKYSVK